MRSWHERRTGAQQKKEEKPKTMSRLFVENKKKHNLSIKEDYLSYNDVAAAINMNAIEQRMMTKEKLLRSLKAGVPSETLIKMLEGEIHLDRHRLVKYYGVGKG